MARARKPRAEEEQLHLFFPPSSSEAPARRTKQQAGDPTPLLSGAGAKDFSLLRVERLPATIRLGTSSWSFPGWEGLVYDRPAPQAQLSRGGLPLYSRHPLLRTVGIDRTYYRPMTAAQCADYAAQVPETFRFLMKAHEYCTLAGFSDHPRYGTRRGQPNSLFLDPHYATQEVIGPFTDGLKDKAGPLLFQFSPQDFASLGGPGHFVERLYRFLDSLPRGPVYAVEIRTTEFFTPEYVDALSAAGACHCMNGHPGMPAVHEQAALIQPEQHQAVVIRWMQARHLSYQAAKQKYAPFNQIVDADPTSRKAIAELCLNASVRRQPAYVIVNNKAEGSAPRSIVQLAEQIVETLDMSEPHLPV